MKILFTLLFLASFAKAHPVIYKDGFVYWGEFSNQKNTQILSYTFHPRSAFQLSSHFEKDSITAYQLGLNFLIKRWLLQDSQANIYTSLQSGFYTKKTSLDSKPLSDRLTFQWNIDLDWESRFVYTAAKLIVKGKNFELKNLSGDFSYRIGFAPYVVGMDALQTWLILMFQASKVTDKQMISSQTNKLDLKRLNASLDWKITPLLRFFYKNVLWEIGSSLQSDFYLTLMVHY